MLSADPWSLFLADTIALLLISASCAVQPAILAENTPPAVRGRLVSLVGAVGAALFGGTAALINTMLSTAGLSWVFTLYVVVMAAIGVAVVVSLRETRGVDLVTLRRSTEKEVSVRRSTDI
jgi:MHS family alpha-ketoglutarate permease-like MFS transporter